MQFEILAQAANIRGRTPGAALDVRTLLKDVMQATLNFLPLAAFMLAYHYGGIYVATAVLMVAMLLLALVDYVRQRRVSPMHALSTVLVLIFGTATLVLHDPRFLKVKPTILLWLMALAFLGSQWIGAAPLSQRMLEPALAPGASISRPQWLRVNLVWVAAYLLLGFLNLYIARTASEQTWVYFKGFGLTIALIVLGVGQALWLHQRRE
jgi:intracellular septation protein